MIGKIETVDSIVWTVTDPSSITEDYTNAATAVGRPVVAPVAAAVPAAPAQAAAVGAAVVAPAAAVAAVAPAQAAAAAPVAPAIVAAAPAADEPFLADDYSLADVWMLYQHNDMQAVADAINEHGSHRKHVTAVELKTFWGLILAGSVSPVRGKKNWSGLSARDKEMQRRRAIQAVDFGGWMPLARFQLIRSLVSWGNSGTAEAIALDPWARCIPAIARWNLVRKRLLGHRRGVKCIDELGSPPGGCCCCCSRGNGRG